MNTTHDHIEINNVICHGKLVIRGTRVPVDIIVGSVCAGMSHQEAINEYGVTAEDIEAAIAYAEATAKRDHER